MAIDVDTAAEPLTGHLHGDDAALLELATDTNEVLEDMDNGDGPSEQPEIADATFTPERRRRWSVLLIAGVAGSVMLAAVVGLAIWLGFKADREHQVQEQRAVFLEVGRQGAINLTTVSYAEVDADISRILKSATGTFFEDFQKNATAFTDVVKQTQAQTVGTVTQAGIESVEGDSARVLVAVTVKTSNKMEKNQEPRHWRMRVTVQKTSDGVKVSNVGFVP